MPESRLVELRRKLEIDHDAEDEFDRLEALMQTPPGEENFGRKRSETLPTSDGDSVDDGLNWREWQTEDFMRSGGWTVSKPSTHVATGEPVGRPPAPRTAPVHDALGQVLGRRGSKQRPAPGELARLKAQGVPVTLMAEHLDVNRKTLQRWMKEDEAQH